MEKNNKTLNVPPKRAQSGFIYSVEHEEQITKSSTSGNVPRLRFPEFSGEWEKTRFENVVSLQRGSSP
ncbi:MAG: restriction endonuclease subunit S, partial [Bacteroidales bacterium]|nr:restriction endonuclease subunit S [Bacteroidales bacterium]